MSLEQQKIEILERELNYYKGQLKYLVGTNVAEKECENVLKDYYKKDEPDDFMNITTDDEKRKPLLLEIERLREKFEIKEKETKVFQFKNKELETKLLQSKDFL